MARPLRPYPPAPPPLNDLVISEETFFYGFPKLSLLFLEVRFSRLNYINIQFY